MRVRASNVRTSDVLIGCIQTMSQTIRFKKLQNSIYRHRQKVVAKLVATEVSQLVCRQRLLRLDQPLKNLPTLRC